MSKLIALIIGVFMAYGAFTVVTNISSMNKIVNVETSLLQNKYELKEMDIGEFKKITLKKYYLSIQNCII